MVFSSRMIRVRIMITMAISFELGRLPSTAPYLTQEQVDMFGQAQGFVRHQLCR